LNRAKKKLDHRPLEKSLMDRSFDENAPDNDSGLRLRMRGEERRISSQHRQLGDLFERTLDSVEAIGPRKAVGDFLLFQTALEAHMSVEEDIYFPALHGLRNDLKDELIELAEEHKKIQIALENVKYLMTRSVEHDAKLALIELANRIEDHEEKEEALLARITEGPLTSFGHTSLDSDF
jgi:hypothetical protein